MPYLFLLGLALLGGLRRRESNPPLDELLLEEGRRIDAVAGVLLQTGFGAFLAGLTLALTVTSLSPATRSLLAVAATLFGLAGCNAGLLLLRVGPLTAAEVARAHKSLNNTIVGFLALGLVTAIATLSVSAILT